MVSERILEDIADRLVEYDNSRPKMDELKFIKGIMDDYGLSRKETIKLIQQVRRVYWG